MVNLGFYTSSVYSISFPHSPALKLYMCLYVKHVSASFLLFWFYTPFHCSCLYPCIWVYVSVAAHGKAGSWHHWGVVIYLSPLCILRQAPSLELSHWLGCLTSKPPGFTHLYLLQHPELGLQAGVITSSFCMGSKELTQIFMLARWALCLLSRFPTFLEQKKKITGSCILEPCHHLFFFLGKIFKPFPYKAIIGKLSVSLPSWCFIFLLVLKGSTGFMSLSLFPLFSITFYFFWLLLF